CAAWLAKVPAGLPVFAGTRSRSRMASPPRKLVERFRLKRSTAVAASQFASLHWPYAHEAHRNLAARAQRSARSNLAARAQRSARRLAPRRAQPPERAKALTISRRRDAGLSLEHSAKRRRVAIADGLGDFIDTACVGLEHLLRFLDAQCLHIVERRI